MSPTATAVKSSSKQLETMPKPVETALPDFIQAINDDYKSQVAHVFLLHGNIYDFCDNSGKDLTVKQVFTAAYDDNFQKDLAVAVKDTGNGLTDGDDTVAKLTRILITYNISQGLEYPHPQSYEMMKSAIAVAIGSEKVNEAFMHPKSPGKLIEFMNLWFDISKQRTKTNQIAKKQSKSLQEELLVTWLITDADSLFPRGEIANLGADRLPIVSVRQWAQDEWLANRNRIILMCRHAVDLHESIRGEISAIHMVRKPNLEDRKQYIAGFDRTIQERAKRRPTKTLRIGKNTDVTSIDWAADFGPDQCAVQSAGMNRKQLKDVFLNSWMTMIPTGYDSVRERKQRALQNEYQGMIDFKEPEFGFEQVGGHEAFKKFCRQQIIIPLQTGDKRTCARGALLCGPPGTGKSFLAWALAKEAKMNYLIVDLSKVFGGLVGETESNMRKLLEAIEAAAPCIVFVDELDSVLSAGRTSAGDSGTSGRVFNSFMTFMSDPGRAGKIVVLAATNRPDLLDAALIRAGRFDAKIAILPPARNDERGRKAILKALIGKHSVKFAKDLAPTMDNKEDGLGRLLCDSERLWTGAEIEVVMKKAISTAAFAERKTEDGDRDYTITLEDWNHAMDVILPNTNEVEFQTKLALLYCDDLDYVAEGWRNLVADKDQLRRDLGMLKNQLEIED